MTLWRPIFSPALDTTRWPIFTWLNVRDREVAMKRGQLSERQARSLIQREWTNWPGRSGGTSDKTAFYDWLVESRPQLLHFHVTGDMRMRVTSWLSGSK